MRYIKKYSDLLPGKQKGWLQIFPLLPFLQIHSLIHSVIADSLWSPLFTASNIPRTLSEQIQVVYPVLLPPV